jgi:hypothetical protein
MSRRVPRSLAPRPNRAISSSDVPVRGRLSRQESRLSSVGPNALLLAVRSSDDAGVVAIGELPKDARSPELPTGLYEAALPIAGKAAAPAP